MVYGAHGVCIVREEEERIVDRKKRIFLALEPLGQPGARYLVPTHSPAAMAKLQPMLSAGELEALLRSREARAGIWIREDNQRKAVCRELISCGDRVKLMQMMHCLYRHREAQTAIGKRLHISDSNFLRDAEKLLAGELAIVMGMQTGEAIDYIRANLREE